MTERDEARAERDALKLKLEAAKVVLGKFTAKAELTGNPVWGLEVSYMAREAISQLNESNLGAVQGAMPGARVDQREHQSGVQIPSRPPPSRDDGNTFISGPDIVSPKVSTSDELRRIEHQQHFLKP